MESIEVFIDRARKMKEGMDWEDLQPMLDIEHVDGSRSIVTLVDLPNGPVLHRAIFATLLRVREELGEVKAVALLSDARMRKLEKGQERPPNDDLQAKWEAGEREGIVECLIVITADNTGQTRSASVSYDAEQRTWSDVVDMGDKAMGGIPEALSLGINPQKVAERVHQLISSLGIDPADEEALHNLVNQQLGGA